MADFQDTPVCRTDKTDETPARAHRMKYWQTLPAHHRSRLRLEASASSRPTPSLDERLTTYKAAKAQRERDIEERKQALEQYARQRPAHWSHEWWPLSHALAWACCRDYAEASRLLAHGSSPSRMDLSVLNSNIRLGASLVTLNEAASMLFGAFKRGAVPVQADDGSRRTISSGEWVDYDELRAGSPTWDLRPLDRSGQRPELRRIQVQASQLLMEIPPIAESVSAVARGKRGPKFKYDWNAFRSEAERQLEYEGSVAPHNGSSFTQAALESRMEKWCGDNWENVPSESQIRQYVVSALRAYEAANLARRK